MITHADHASRHALSMDAEREPHPVGMVNVKDDTSKICKVRRIHPCIAALMAPDPKKRKT